MWPILGSGRSMCPLWITCQGAEVWGARLQKNTPTDRITICWCFSSFIGHKHKDIYKGEKSITLETIRKTKNDYEINLISENIPHQACVLGLVVRYLLASKQLIRRMRGMDQLFTMTLSRPVVLVKLV